MGDERRGLRLPGVRTNNPDGSFDVKYDIPLAFYDVRLDDGVTTHQDIHDGMGEFPDAGNPRTHPEWWGHTFYKHFPNHGFVGDIFTVNGTAYPVLNVDRRKYRFRFLDASIARCYEFKLMSSTQGPKTAISLGNGGDELQGQYRIPDGQQCMKFTQIASDGGLLPFRLIRDSFELWPAKRREFIVDFTKYMDGTPARPRRDHDAARALHRRGDPRPRHDDRPGAIPASVRRRRRATRRARRAADGHDRQAHGDRATRHRRSDAEPLQPHDVLDGRAARDRARRQRADGARRQRSITWRTRKPRQRGDACASPAEARRSRAAASRALAGGCANESPTRERLSAAAPRR